MVSDQVTRDEIDALRAVAKHGTTLKAAKALFVSHGTVRKRLASLRDKTGIREQPRLILWGVAEGHLSDCLPTAAGESGAGPALPLSRAA